MDVGDVEALEVVVEVQSPVRVYQVVAGTRGVERELAKRKCVEAASHRAGDLLEPHRRRERDHEETGPRTERDGGQIVGLRREIRGPLELRHRVKAAVEGEPPAVVAAPQLLLVAGAIDDDRPAMRAHIRNAVDLVLLISREKERLIERAWQ